MAENNYPDGTPYRPSNGTEGSIFYCQWCSRCKKDKDMNCSILADTMFFDVGEAGYPVEWIWQKGKPVCTAFDDQALKITNQERAAQVELPLSNA